jgi:hypothetical protein
LTWSGLQTFFEVNSQLFPVEIGYKGGRGARLCKIATILDMTIILSFIAEILRIIGYFKLASTKNIGAAPGQVAYQPAPTQPAPVAAPVAAATTPKFCPNCGGSITPGAKFCPSCGSEIR